MNGESGHGGQNLSTMKSDDRSSPSAAHGRGEAKPTRIAFVMEQALGHVTHSRNLMAAAQARATLSPTWLPVPFAATGTARMIPLLRSNWSVRASWRARRALDQALAEASHDAIVFHTQVTALFSVAHMRRIPSVVSLDATPINYDTVGASYNHKPAGDGWLDRQKYRMNKAVFEAAGALVTWSDWAKWSLTNDYAVDAAKIRVIAPGAADAYFEIGARRHADERQLGLPRVLFVGGDFERKGGPLLLESMRGPLGERCELHVVTKEALPPMRNVHVYNGLGPNSPELLRLFEQADVFVLPSRGECLAVVLMEATAAGLPIVTTDIAALGEAVDPNKSGLLIPPADGRSLQSALETLVGDASLRQRMGRAGLELARRKFSANRNNEALLDLTEAIAHARLSGARRVA
jgi:glycosyltransferase involved in cell wall biosynthesis